MRLRARRAGGIALAACLLALAACATTPRSSFYVLSSLPLPVDDSVAAAPAGPASGPTLGIGPVSLPPYLDRPEIVTRTGSHQLQLAEYHRWGEPLEDNIARVLGENLAVLVPSENVVSFPWRRSAGIDYQVIVEVREFERGADGDVSLRARWQVRRGDGQRVVTRDSNIAQPARGSDYGAIATAMSGALEQLSREIAAAIPAARAASP